METLRMYRIGFVWILLSCHQQIQAAESLGPDPLSLLNGRNCPLANEVDCESLKQDINEIWKQMQATPAPLERAVLRLKLNQTMEHLHLVTNGASAEDLQALEDKYAALHDILRQTERRGLANAPKIAYHPLELKAVQEVMDRYGKLELNPASVSPNDQPRWMTREVALPWSSYWYPRYDPVMYRGDSSLMAKVDRIMTKIGRSSKAQDWESAMSEGYPESWEGLCNAWSIAAIREPEPQTAIYVQGETLSIAEQKALYIKLYETFPVTTYGVRYDGDFETDGTYQDIRPEAMHRLALSYLGTLNKPFVIDDTAGVEVWQQPVFRVDWLIHADANYANAYQISMRLWKIKMRSKISDELTGLNDYSFDSFKYRLFVDPKVKKQQGRLVVIAGEWLEDSRRNHPDFVVVPEENGLPGSFNTSIQSNADSLLDMLRQSASFNLK